MMRCVLLLALSCAVVAGPGGPRRTQAVTQPPGLDREVAARIDDYMAAQRRVNEFSGVILLARDGVPLFQKAYGWANAEWQIANSPQTRFRIGSVTKQFTSMAIMQLQQQGKLAVQDPICRYLVPCPAAWMPITVHHLLTHTSGIPSFTNLPSYRQTMMLPRTAAEMVAVFRDLPLEFEPGSQFKYDNSGYYLLGMIIEKASGRKYQDVLQAQIFDPLGMKDTGYDHAETIVPRRASGYSGRGDRMVNAAPIDMSQPYAAGALYSTVGDLLIWDQALYTDRLLPAPARAAMFTPFRQEYAYGWMVRAASPANFGHRLVEHSGGINGFTAMLVRLPDDRVTSIALCNNATSPCAQAAHDIVNLYFRQPVTFPAPPR